MRRFLLPLVHHNHTLAALTLAGVLVAGCASGPAVSVTPTPSPTAPSAATATSVPVVPVTPTFTPAAPDGREVFADPLAEEAYLWARQDLAGWLEVDPETIELVELTIVVWPDTSRGCPQEGWDYEHVEVPGYRLVLQVDDETYYYHADFSSGVRCDAEDEVLPE